MQRLKAEHQQWVDEILREDEKGLDSKNFVENTHEVLRLRVPARKVEVRDGRFVLKEDASPYNAHFDPKKGLLRAENSSYLER